MADTLLSLVTRVLRATGQNPSISAFSDNNDTQYLVDRINEALQELYGLLPTQIDVDSSISLPVSTRTVAVPTGVDPQQIYDWSFRINDSTNGDIRLQVVTKEFIVRSYPLYESYTAVYPKYVYIDNGTLAFFPLVQASGSTLTIQFTYPAIASRLSLTTATFVFPDNSDEIKFLEKHAQYEYEMYKGIGQPLSTNAVKEDILAKLKAKYRKSKRVGFKPYRRFGS